MELITQAFRFIGVNDHAGNLASYDEPKRSRTVSSLQKNPHTHAENCRQVFLQGLADSLQWSQGCSTRIGTVRVETQTRTSKDSARYHAMVVAIHGTALTNGDD